MAPKRKKVLKEDWKSTANTVADVGQFALDVAGSVPGFEAADLANAAIYVMRGNYLFAGLSLISAIPVIGDIIGKGGKMTAWLSKTFPKAAGQVAKYGPDVVSGVIKAKKAIVDHQPEIMAIIAGIHNMAKSNPAAAKIVPHLPQIQQAINIFAQSPTLPQQQASQQVAAEGLFLPSMTSMLFEDHDISDVIEKAAKTKNKSEKTNLLKKYHLMRNDGDQEPINVGEPGDATTGDHLFNQIFENNEVNIPKEYWDNLRKGDSSHVDASTTFKLAEKIQEMCYDLVENDNQSITVADIEKLARQYFELRRQGHRNPQLSNGSNGDYKVKQTLDYLSGADFDDTYLSESHVISGGISSDEAKKLAVELDLNFNTEDFDFSDFLKGANHEIEHAKTVDKSPSTIARIAVDHLREDSKYYDKLMKIEAFAPKLKDFL